MSSQLPSFLRIELLSDATFSRGGGTPGVVDIEVEHDDYGLPFIGGRTVRGLLRDAWLSMHRYFPELEPAAVRVLGKNRALDESCRLRVGDALLPAPVREAVRRAVERREPSPLPPETILAALTSIRYQTAEERETGAPAEVTLRSSRVVLRGLFFDARLTWLSDGAPADPASAAEDRRLLALCALAVRHGGMLRNRGRGHLRVTLDGDLELTRRWAGGAA
ncbi:MAG: hypothetical protein RMI94_14150 [Bryobacterales bacterium]|nr:hypothetical protein [Bryobacteraceae bacterium]MDW8131689.1 hypothetical protein [Bryobacterales bacterium]